MVKNLCASAEGMDSVPGSGRSPGEGNGSPLHILPWKIPWTGEPGSPWGCKESDMTERTRVHKHTHTALSDTPALLSEPFGH